MKWKPDPEIRYPLTGEEVQEIEKREAEELNRRRWRITMTVSIVSLIVSLAELIIVLPRLISKISIIASLL